MRLKNVLIVVALGIEACAPVAAANDLNEKWNELARKTTQSFEEGNLLSAQASAQQSLALAVSKFGEISDQAEYALVNLGRIYERQGNLAQAEASYKKLLALRKTMRGDLHPLVADCLDDLGSLYRSFGKLNLAEKSFKDSLAILEEDFGDSHPRLSDTLNYLGMVYRDRGDLSSAERSFRHALDLLNEASQADNPSLRSAILNNLAMVYVDTGQADIAESLYSRALAQIRLLPKKEANQGPVLANLAQLYRSRGDYARALESYEDAARIVGKAFGNSHVHYAEMLFELANFHIQQDAVDKARPLLDQLLPIQLNALGPNSLAVARTYSSYAQVLLREGDTKSAEQRLVGALNIRESIGVPTVEWADDLVTLAALKRLQGQPLRALEFARRASTIYRDRLAIGDERITKSLRTRQRWGFDEHLHLLSMNPAKTSEAEIVDESFQLGQWAQLSETAATVAGMAARFASGSDEVANVARRLQDAGLALHANEDRLAALVAQPPLGRNPAVEAALRAEIAHLGSEVTRLDNEISKTYPRYRELMRPGPATARQAQASLRPDEALLTYTIGDSATYVWVIRPDRHQFIRLDIARAELEKQIAGVREEMQFNVDGEPREVGLDRLHGLYERLFAPIASQLGGVHHVLLVTSGPLQSIPFGLLVTQGASRRAPDGSYRDVDWLVKHYAFSVLPSVSSLVSLRRDAQRSRAPQPFLGIGDPLLQELTSGTRQARVDLRPSGAYRNLVVARTIAPPAGLADVELIRQQPRLPETAEELTAMAATMRATKESLWLGERATETNVKRIDLAKYRIIAFATHGVAAGEIGVGMEPGLLLTPPKVGTERDDGFLSASEVARLSLDAEWVILSACNTAASDGSPHAEGLSGLAKAFFYAGARSMLVSNWPVASNATVPLTTTALGAFERTQNQGKAEALRQSIIQLMNSRSPVDLSHPVYWAPFILVGDGGASKNP